MKNYTHKLFGKLGTWLMILLFISAAPFAKAQELGNIIQFLDENDNVITQSHTGEKITVEVETTSGTFETTISRYMVVNQEFLNTGGASGLSFPVTAVTAAGDPVVISVEATVPHNHLDHGLNNLYVIYRTEGASFVFGNAPLNQNIIPENDTEYIGGYLQNDGSTNWEDWAVMDQQGAREIISEPFNVHNITNSAIALEIRRISTEPAPSNAKILLEYSKDGETWTAFKEIPLDMGTAFTLKEYNLVAAMESENTQFRLRQQSNTFVSGDHGWYVRNFNLTVPASGNNYVQSNWVSFNVLTPTYDVALSNPGTYDIGANVSVTITNVLGKFPDNTKFEKYIQNDLTGDKYHEGVLTTAPVEDATFTVKAPFIQYPTSPNRITLRAENAEGYIYQSTTGTFSTNQVTIALDEITLTSPIEDGGVEKTSPGKEIVAKYTITGEYPKTNMEVVLEYELGGNWFSLTSAAPANSGTQGTLTANLPFMDLGTNLPVRVRLTNTDVIGYQNQVIDRNNSNYDVGQYTVVEGSRFGFQIYGEVLETQDVSIEYSIDNGTTWEVMDSKAVTAGFEGFIFHYAVDLFDVPEAGNIRFRSAQSGEMGTIDAQVIGHRLEQPIEIPEITAQQTIGLINPSLTFSSMQVVNEENLVNGSQYLYGTEYSIKYTTNGLWPAETYFAFVIEKDDNFLLLTESNEQGEKTVQFTIPTKEELEAHFGTQFGANEDINVKAYAYSQHQDFGGYDGLKLFYNPIVITTDDYIEKEWNYFNNNWIYFSNNGERYAVTKAYNLTSVAEPLFLNFTYYGSIGNKTLNTLPKVQVSIDNGVTYHDLEITQESSPSNLQYHDLNRLEASGTYDYSIAIPKEYQKEAVHFRFAQGTLRPSWTDPWYINNNTKPSISGESNELGFYDKFSGTQQITLTTGEVDCATYNHSLMAYYVSIVDEDLDPRLTPTPKAGEEFDFEMVHQGSASSSASNYNHDTRSSDFGDPDPSMYSNCPKSLTVTIPENAIITNVYTYYYLFSNNGADLTQARSRIVCTNNGGVEEGSYFSGVSASGGTYGYRVVNLNTFNAVTGGGDITFELHLFRTWGGTDCNTDYLYSRDWELRVDYTLSPAAFPQGTLYTLALEHTNGDPVLDPETEEPVVLGTYTANETNDTVFGAATIPTFVETGVYNVRAYTEYQNNEELCQWDGIVRYNLLVENEYVADPLQLSLVSPNNADAFMTNDEVDFRYSTYGDWPTDVKMAAVVKANLGGGKTHFQVIGQSTQKDAEVTIADVNMIDAPWYDNNNDAITNYEIGVVAYQGDDLILQNQSIGALTKDDDFIEFVGSTDLGNYFNQVGERKALTRAFDLTALTDVSLQFQYRASNITPSANTLPQLLVTTDGGETFDTLVVEQSPYGEIGLLDPNTGWVTYTVPVDEKHLTAATHFMWVQPINQGANQDEWSIRNIFINSGNSNVFEGFERWVDITLDWPKLGNYTWEIIANEQGLEPTLYNGTTFNFGWTLNVDPTTEEFLPALPTDTEVEFFLWDAIADDFVLDPANGEPISLGKTTKVDTLEASIPFLLERDNYTVRAFAVLDDLEYDESNVSTINIYNAVIRPTLVEANPVLFSGNEVEFEATLENTIDPAKFNDTWFNLIMSYDGKDWLMATQQGLTNNFTATIPPFVNGANNFRIEASDTEAMGEVGDILSSLANKTLANADFPTWYVGNHNVANNTNGLMGQLVSDPLDLTTFEAVKFKLKIEKPLEELTDDQKMVFSYSIDGGVSFVDIHTYPDTRFVDSVYFDNEDPTDWFNEELTLPAEAITEETILRWRVEESKGFARIDEIQLMAIAGDYNQVPVNSISTNVSIRQQRINVTPVSLSACPDATVELDYNIRGRFGDDVIVGVQANLGGTINIEGKPLTFDGVTHGTGTVSFNLGLIDNELSGSNVTFRLTINDETNPDYPYDTGDINSYYSENGVNILEVNASSVTLAASPQESCANEERIITIGGIQPYYSYELINFVTGETIYEAIIADPENEELTTDETSDGVYPYYNTGSNALKVNIGAIDEFTRIEVKVTALNSLGTSCESKIPDQTIDLEVRDSYALFIETSPGVWSPLADGESFVYCGSANTDRFAIGYYNNSGNFAYANAKWYRVRQDESMLLLSTSNVFNTFNSSGTYVAKFDDGDCGQIEYSFNVTINELPEQPQITIGGEIHNSIELCHDGEVILTATEGYNYYKWTRNGSVVFGNNQSITVTEAGTYRVQVSNAPFGDNCPSDNSKPVDVIVNDLQTVSFASTTVNLCPSGDGVAEVTVNNIEQDVTYHLVNNATADTVATFASTNWRITFETEPITEDSQYSVYAEHDVNGCTKLVSNNILTIRLLPTYELLAHNGTYYEPALEAYCQGTTLAIGEADGTLATAGTTRWYKDNILIDAGFNTFASEPGIYWAEWELNEDCTYTTEQVTISSNPVRPTITYTEALEFCEGNGSLTLTAPEGFAQYEWTRNNSTISNVASTESSIAVNLSGDYRVKVINENGCESEPSSAVEVTVHSKPNTPNFTVINRVLCEPGVVSVEVHNAQSDVYYQLYNSTTGEATGDARLGSDNLILQSGVITENTKIEVRANRAEVDGCYAVAYYNNEIKVYDLYIEVNGNTLIASIPYDQVDSYQWYRNDRLISNGGTSRTLNIYDDATYKVVVVTYDGCTLESSVGRDGEPEPAQQSVATSLSLFPNPASDNITINFTSADDNSVRIRILNISGEVVFEKEVEKANTELKYVIPVRMLNNGAYIIHVIGKQDVKVQQFIKF